MGSVNIVASVMESTSFLKSQSRPENIYTLAENKWVFSSHLSYPELY